MSEVVMLLGLAGCFLSHERVPAAPPEDAATRPPPPPSDAGPPACDPTLATWEITPVALIGDGEIVDVQLAVGPAGTTHLLFAQRGAAGLTYARGETGFVPEPAGDSFPQGPDAIAVLPTGDGVEAVYFGAGSDGVIALRHATRGADGSWASEEITRRLGHVVRSPRVAATRLPDGELHVVFRSGYANSTGHARGRPGAWTVEGHLTLHATDPAFAAAVDGSGRVHAALVAEEYRYDAMGHLIELVRVPTYALDFAPSPLHESPAPPGALASRCPLSVAVALAPDGTPRVAHTSGAERCELLLSTQAAGSFGTTAIPAGEVPAEVDLITDRAGRDHLAFRDATTGALHYTTDMDGSHRLETVDTGVAVGPSLALTAGNQAVLAYALRDGPALRVAVRRPPAPCEH